MSAKTKVCPCVDCGENVEVSKFMSALKVKCEKCKTGEKPVEVVAEKESNTPPPVKAAEVKKEESAPIGSGRIDGKPNRALMNLCCPFHPHERMHIVGVIKSERWGDIVDFQCRVRGCWCKVSVSQQNQRIGPVKTSGDGLGWEPDVTIEQIKNGEAREIAEVMGLEVKHSE